VATIIETRNLTHRYGKLTAVNDVSLQIQQGDIFGFVGPNGAGKTTTMRILATLLRPTSGDAWVGGCSVRTELRGVRRQIGYMPDFFGVYNEMKVWEYLDFFAACYDIPSHQRVGLIDDLLQLVDLHHRREDYVDSLSRGMKQRLCLARTLAHDPAVLILDEPASGLDPRARIEIRALLRELQAMGKTIFLSSHILLEVSEICTRIGIIEAGELVAYGPMDEIRAAAQQRRRTRRVRITLTDRAEEAMSALRSMPQVHDVVLSERPAQQGAKQGANARGVRAFALLVDFEGDDLAQTALLTHLIQAGFPVIGYQEIQVELEDVFMQVTKGIVS
jgi:ABC-2 type transport system ATP-binding protein